MFNRRRQGEVSKMKVADYQKKHKAIQTDMCKLSVVVKGLCNIMEMIEIVGKRGRTVPVIVTPAMTEQLEVLLEKRESVGVSADNTYLFARSSYASLGYVRGSDCLRKHAALRGAANPQSIRSTKLQKHIATASQMLSLSEQQLDLLASYMGHDLRVHREYYQIPDSVQRVAKLSKIFISLEKGTLPSQQGKSLDELSVDDHSSDEDTDQSSSDDDPMESQPIEESNKENLSKDKQGVRHHQIPAAAETSAKGKKRPWNEDEIHAIQSLKPVLSLHLPGKTEIEKVQRQHQVLQDVAKYQGLL